MQKKLRDELLLVADKVGYEPQAIVDWAEAHPNSIVHTQFEWNEPTAANEYRLTQCRQLLARLIYRPEKDTGPRRMLLSIGTGSDRTYEPRERVLADERMRVELSLLTLKRHHSELEGIGFKEVKPVIAAQAAQIEALEARLQAMDKARPARRGGAGQGLASPGAA